MLKLSIIIPVYNTEKYIERCLESVCNQDLNKSDYEVIVINDGSPDDSKRIIIEQQEIYSNILYFEQENKGLGAARNAGIRLAQGKYLMFVDSDDFLVPHCLQLLYNTISASDAKVLHGDALNLEENKEIEPEKLEIKCPPVEKSAGKNFILQNIDKIKTEAWRCVYDRKFIIRNQLYFPEGVFFEDIGYILKAIYQADEIVYFPYTFYVYYLRTNTISRTKYTLKHYTDRMSGYISAFQYFYDDALCRDNNIREVIMTTLSKLVKNLIHSTASLKFGERVFLFRRLAKSGLIDGILTVRKGSGDIKSRLSFNLLKHSPVMYTCIVETIAKIH